MSRKVDEWIENTLDKVDDIPNSKVRSATRGALATTDIIGTAGDLMQYMAKDSYSLLKDGETLDQKYTDEEVSQMSYSIGWKAIGRQMDEENTYGEKAAAGAGAVAGSAANVGSLFLIPAATTSIDLANYGEQKLTGEPRPGSESYDNK